MEARMYDPECGEYFNEETQKAFEEAEYMRSHPEIMQKSYKNAEEIAADILIEDINSNSMLENIVYILYNICRNTKELYNYAGYIKI